ncbi:MAG: maltokinase [Acidimicrobiaceae bacterium]|nr:maltokinase [Acidimicrobiaceae bacterium]
MNIFEASDAELPATAHGALAELLSAFVNRQPGWTGSAGQSLVDVDPASVSITSADVIRPGRPGLISVVGEVAGVDEIAVHAVLGLRAPGDDVRFLADADDAPLGLLEDEHGMAVVFDALSDAELSLLLLGAVGGGDGEPERVRRVWTNYDSVTLTFDDQLSFTVYQQLPMEEGPHPGLELVLALDDVGFNHVPAPYALWRRSGRDLGVAQDYQPGGTGGWALALTSLRDLYALGGSPEQAGGDFATEAGHLGTMTARMHLGLEQAFGRQEGDVATWVAGAEEAVSALDPDQLLAGVSAVLAGLQGSSVRASAIRTHGDFHLGRVSRTDVGWFVIDFSPGGVQGSGTGMLSLPGAVYRSPLADVADMLWSFHHVAEVAAVERDPTGRLRLTDLAQAWESRNRRAFLTGYQGTPGIDQLVPLSGDMVQALVSVFELERSATRQALRSLTAPG